MIHTQETVHCKDADRHCPVLLHEVIGYLKAADAGKFLDCTFGGGGHTRALLESNTENFVYATDCDPDAKKRAQQLSCAFQNFRFYQLNFAELDCVQLPSLNGIIMDLGVSSFQLDDEIRGFSFKHHTVLDMRMDTTRGMSAEEFLRTAPERDLVTAIRDYGEEKYWRRAVDAILDNRKSDSIKYADTFAKLIAKCCPSQKHQKINPATQVFQGIRIFINKELWALEKALPILFDKLALGGRLAVISFHSLEDRITKQFFKKTAGMAVNIHDNQAQQDRMAYGNLVTKKPVSPSQSEIENNPRSRSAKLRVLEKIRNV